MPPHKDLLADTLKALTLLDALDSDTPPVGRGIVALRLGLIDGTEPITAERYRAINLRGQIARRRVSDPKPPALVLVALETLSFRIKARNRDETWQHIGVEPSLGRDWILPVSEDPEKARRTMPWTAWFTLREAAFAPGPHV